jgi:hypothetical protein
MVDKAELEAQREQMEAARWQRAVELQLETLRRQLKADLEQAEMLTNLKVLAQELPRVRRLLRRMGTRRILL